MTNPEMQRLRKKWSTFYSKNDDTRWYVYVYRYPQGDPDAGKAFYIGKGTGNRVFNHLDLQLKADMKEEKKVQIIQELKSRNLSPDIELLQDSLCETDALAFESIAIDAVGLENLTNLVSGHNSERCPISLSEKVLHEAKIEHKMLGIKINRSFPQYFPNRLYDSANPDHQQKLYECTTQQWVLRAERLKSEGIKYYCAVYQGIILDVFELDADKPYLSMADAVNHKLITRLPDGRDKIAGFHHRLLAKDEIDPKRVMLFGHPAPTEIRNRYQDTKVLDNNGQNSIMYLFPVASSGNYEHDFKHTQEGYR